MSVHLLPYRVIPKLRKIICIGARFNEGRVPRRLNAPLADQAEEDKKSVITNMEDLTIDETLLSHPEPPRY